MAVVPVIEIHTNDARGRHYGRAQANRFALPILPKEQWRKSVAGGADAVEELGCSEEKLVAGDCWRGECKSFELVHGDDIELWACLKDADDCVFVDDVGLGNGER